jgi:integrase
MAPEYPSTPPLGFTDAWIRDLPVPEEQRYERFDRGLCVRVEQSGSKAFRWYYQADDGQGGRQKRSVVLGPWAHPSSKPAGYLEVADARSLLDRAKQAHKAGNLAEFEAGLGHGKSRVLGGGGKTVKELAEEFYTLRILPKRKATPQEVRRTLDNDILPAIGAKPLRAVRAEHCRDIVRAVVQRDSPSQAGKVFAHMDFLFRWARGCGEDLPVNPMEMLDPDALGVVNNERDRFLTEDEIPLYWHGVERRPKDEKLEPGMEPCAFPRCGRAARAKTYCFGHYRQMTRGRELSPLEGISRTVQIGLRIMLLIPERTAQLLKGEWTEMDFDEALWTVPIAHQKLNPRSKKKSRDRRVPLTPRVIELFRELQNFAGGSRFIMASDDSETGRLNDKALIQALTSLTATERLKGRKKIPVKPVLALPGGHLTVHDLRHTFRTLAVEKLGLLPMIAEQCLAHSEGAMAGRYNHYDYLRERREALERWTEYVYRLVEPMSTNVAFLPGRAERG